MLLKDCVGTEVGGKEEWAMVVVVVEVLVERDVMSTASV